MKLKTWERHHKEVPLVEQSHGEWTGGFQGSSLEDAVLELSLIAQKKMRTSQTSGPPSGSWGGGSREVEVLLEFQEDCLTWIKGIPALCPSCLMGKGGQPQFQPHRLLGGVYQNKGVWKHAQRMFLCTCWPLLPCECRVRRREIDRGRLARG